MLKISKKFKAPFLIILFIVFSGVFPVSAKNYYVSTSGNNSNDGSLESPFKTIQKAANMLSAGDTCFIRGGIYRETVTPEDTGFAGNPIVFMPYQCEIVTVSGLDEVTGKWENYKGNIYKTYIPWSMGAGNNMLFVNNKLTVQGRHPNGYTGGLPMPQTTNPLSPLWPTFGKFNITNGSKYITSNDLRQSANFWKGALYVGFHKWSWCMQTAYVETSSYGRIGYTNATPRYWFPDQAVPLKEWFRDGNFDVMENTQNGFLTNHINCVDTIGEWQLQNDTLYFYNDGEPDLNSSLFEAKKRILAFNLKGKAYITINGLNVIGASMNLYNSINCVINNCRLSYISHFTYFKDSRNGLDVPNPWGNAANMEKAPYNGEYGVIVGGRSNSITNTIIEYSAGAGLYLTGLRTTVDHCVIRDCGYGGTYLGNIFISNDHFSPSNDCGGHIITYNDIYNAGRSNINFCGVDPNTVIVMKASSIHNNRIHDGCIIANDGGNIYSFNTDLGTNGQRTKVYNNLIWDCWGTFWAGLTYSDGGTTPNIEYSKNILWNSLENQTAVKAFCKFFLQNGNGTYIKGTELKEHFGGVDGLKESDYPGGYFETGSGIDVNSKPYFSNCIATTIHPVTASKEPTVIIYPNPIIWGQELKIKCAFGDKIISIHNITGKLMSCQKLVGAEDSISTNNLASGVYIVEVESAMQTSSILLVSR